MQIFGLVSLLIVVALGATWMVSSMGNSTKVPGGEGGSVTESTYEEAIDSAVKISDMAEVRNSAPVSSRTVFVYGTISVPDDTQVLDLSNKGLSGSLKAEVRHLTELRELNLSNNNFTGLPAEVGQLSRLEVLNLSNNPLTGLPYEIGNLSRLKTLDLRGTNYAEQDLLIIKQSLPDSTVVLTD